MPVLSLACLSPRDLQAVFYPGNLGPVDSRIREQFSRRSRWSNVGREGASSVSAYQIGGSRCRDIVLL